MRQLERTDGANSAGENRGAESGRRRGHVSLQTDPKVGESWQSYGYSDNNPVMFSDPSGMGFFGDLWDAVKDTANGVYDILVEGSSSECGGGKFEGVPDHVAYFGIYFDSACHTHDLCYRNCCSDKDACDDAFFDAMVEACEKYAWVLFPTCYVAAQAYVAVVRGSQGDSAWEYEQNQFGCSDPSNYSCSGFTAPPFGKPVNGRPASCHEIPSGGPWDLNDLDDPTNQPGFIDPQCVISDPYGRDVFAR